MTNTRLERAAPLVRLIGSDDVMADSLPSTIVRLRRNIPTKKPVTMRSKPSSRNSSSLLAFSKISEFWTGFYLSSASEVSRTELACPGARSAR
jgi:hypothetical protein